MKPNRRLRRRVLWALLPLALLLLALRFAAMRAQDRDAWPAPAPGILLDEPARDGAGEGLPLLDAEDCRALLDAIPGPESAPVAAYRRFQGAGAAALGAEDRAALAARLGPSNATLRAWRGAVGGRGGFDLPSNAASEPLPGVLARFGEMAVLEAWDAADDDGAAPAALAAAAGDSVRLLTHGAGLVGIASALPVATIFAREALMAAADLSAPPPADPAAAIAAFRAAEGGIGPLDAALRHDHALFREAVGSIYESFLPAPRASDAAPDAGTDAPRPRNGRLALVVHALGGREEDTQAHLDALFSHLVANASAPYAPGGAVAGLPAWCREGGRPPWTRDPVGAALARDYVRHAAVAAAVLPGIRLEFRAARIALALRAWREAHGEYPATLDALLAGEAPLLGADDLADPFAAPPGARLGYARDGDGWRLWSAGLDQVDGGGAVDAFTADDPGERKDADFVLTSRERDIRKASLHAESSR